MPVLASGLWTLQFADEDRRPDFSLTVLKSFYQLPYKAYEQPYSVAQQPAAPPQGPTLHVFHLLIVFSEAELEAPLLEISRTCRHVFPTRYL